MRHFFSKMSLVLAISLSFNATAYAAEKIELHGHDLTVVDKLNRHGINKEARSAAVPGLGTGKSYMHSFRGKIIGLGTDDSFHAFRESTDKAKIKHTRYQQKFKNIPVFAKELILHEDKSGRILQVNGSFVKGIEQDLGTNVSLAPAYSATEALEKAKIALSEDSLAKRRRHSPPEIIPPTDRALPASGRYNYRNEQSELNIYVDGNNQPRLVYYVNFLAEPTEGGEPTRPYQLIDATTGHIIKRWEGLTHQAIGTGPGGNTKVGQYEYGTNFGFLDVLQNGTLCTMQNASVTTVDMTGMTSSYATPFSYDCPRNTLKTINGAYSPLNDAHYFGGIIVNMYTSWYGFPPIPLPLVMRPHYGTNYENAFWDGQYMTFGDGYSTFYPLVSLDVAAHEVSHGFTEFNSNLIYEKESGGINESFSDMAGEAAKYFKLGSNNWRMGADITKASGPLRYLDNPPADGYSISDYSLYTDSLDVHYSSGLFNNAFYLLATKPGWTTKKAFDVMVKANMDYWISSSTFRSAACGAISAATDLSYSSTDVDNAFREVNVYCGAPDITISVLPPTTISGSSSLANVSLPFSQTFTASGTAPPYAWSKLSGTLPPGTALNGTTGEISGTPSALGSYGFTLQVADSLGRKNFIKWTVVVGSGLRAGWPKELAQRAGSGWLSSSYSPVFADLNGDGKDEIIAVDGYTLYLLNETGVYKQVTLPGKLSAPAVADLDNDGQKEIVVTASYGATAPIYAFHGDLMPVDGFPAGRYADYTFVMGSPVIAELATDGTRQIVAVGYPNMSTYPDVGKEIIQMVDHQGHAVTGWPKPMSTDPNFPLYDKTVAVGDLDSDGINEIVFTSSDGKAHIFRENGSELAQWPIAATVASSESPILADVNGDGKPEIIVGYSIASGSYAINIYDKDGISLSGWPWIKSGGKRTPTVIADLDGDGLPEIVTGTSEDVSGIGTVDYLTVLRANGSNLPGWPVNIQRIFSIDSYPIIGDINGDGHREILVTTMKASSSCGTGWCDVFDSAMTAYRFDGQPVNGYPKSIPNNVELRSAPAIGDLDNNGKVDLALKSEDGMIYVWEADSASMSSSGEWPMYLHDSRHSGELPILSMVVPTSYDFGEIVVGSSSTPLNLTITNRDPAPITISTLAVTGSDNTMFSVSSGTCGTLPVTLAHNSSCTVTVTFTPSSSGNKNAALTVNSTSYRGIISVQLSGTGLLYVQRTLTLTNGGNGTGTISFSPGAMSCTNNCSQSFDSGTVVTLTATADADSVFVGWNGACSGTGSCTVAMIEDKLVTATMEKKPIISYNRLGTGMGTVTFTPGTICVGKCSQYYDQGSVVTLTAAAFGNSVFTGWEGACSGTGPCVVSLDGDKAVSATFTGDLPENVAIAAGDSHTVALRYDGTVWTWGNNSNGQLGDGTNTSRSTPAQVPGLSGVVGIAAGFEHSLAVKADGTIWAWGSNGSGQLGDGTTTMRKSPVQVSGLTNVIAIDGGSGYTIAVKDDGTVWAWGYNAYGQVGDGTTNSRWLPVKLPNILGVVAVKAANAFTYALKSDGTVWGWGINSLGQLGDGTTIQRLSPTRVLNLTDIIAIDGGWNYGIALKNSGKIWSWGGNIFGQLGDGTTAQRNSPVQVTGTYVGGSAGGVHTLALKSVSSLSSWGRNDNGQLGDGTTTTRLSATSVSGLTGISRVAAGTNHSVALKNDGTVWSWGANSSGQLGDGTTTSRTSPVQVQDIKLHLPTANISGTPTSPTNSTSASLTVGGTGVVTYKYKLDAGSYSTETAVATPISITSLSEGTHTVSVIGKDSIGNWQVTPTIVSWTVDLTPPTATVSGTPESPTQSTGATLTIGGADVVVYKYKLDAGSYSAETPVVTPIILNGLADGSHTVSVLGKDSADNWQLTPTTAAWSVDLPVSIPGSGGYTSIQAAYDALLGDNVLLIKGNTLVENLVFNRNLIITIRGGFDPASGTCPGFTNLIGSLEISAGTVVVENLVIAPPN